MKASSDRLGRFCVYGPLVYIVDLLVDTVGKKKIEGKITCKHFIKVLGKFSESSSIAVMGVLLHLCYTYMCVYIQLAIQISTCMYVVYSYKQQISTCNKNHVLNMCLVRHHFLIQTRICLQN